VAPYAILGVRTPEAPVDPMFPQLTDDLSPIMDLVDGADLITHPVRGIWLLKDTSGGIEVAGGASDLQGTLSITDQRLIVICKNYDKVRWDRFNSLNSVNIGLGTETAFHLGEKAIRRVKTRGKVMCGHIYFPWVQFVGWAPFYSKKLPAKLRIGLNVKASAEAEDRLFLEVGLDVDIDAAQLAQFTARRVAQWWVASTIPLKSFAGSFHELGAVGLLESPDRGNMATYEVPFHMFAHPTNTPATLARRF